TTIVDSNSLSWWQAFTPDVAACVPPLCRLSASEEDQSNVILLHIARKAQHFIPDSLGTLTERCARLVLDRSSQALDSELFSTVRRRFSHTVRVKQHRFARREFFRERGQRFIDWFETKQCTGSRIQFGNFVPRKQQGRGMTPGSDLNLTGFGIVQ